MINFVKKNIVWIFSLLIAIFLLFKSDLRRKQETNRYQSNISILRDSIVSYSLSNGQLVDSKRSIEVTNKELKNEIFIKDDSLKELLSKFRKIKATVKIKTVFKVDTIRIAFDSTRSEKPIKNFKYKDNYLSLSGNVNNSGITINEIEIPNTQRLVIGNRKTGFFNSQLEVSITNSNPLLKVKDIESQIVTIKNKKFHVLGFAGIDYTLSPTIGIGLGYSLFSL